MLRESTGVLEGDLAWQGWVRDVFPFERGWFYSAVVDPGSNLCGGGRQNNDKRTPSMGF
jgi:hypothetical protein